jgi:hypothetical protein
MIASATARSVGRPSLTRHLRMGAYGSALGTGVPEGGGEP